jgi:hypothetical protein
MPTEFRVEIKPMKEMWHADLLPAMEKMGRTAQLLLTPDQVMLVQLQDDGAEGSLVKLELPTVCSPHLSAFLHWLVAVQWHDPMETVSTPLR